MLVRTAVVVNRIQYVNDRGESVSVTLTDVIFSSNIESNLVLAAKLSNKRDRAEFDKKICNLVYGLKGVVMADKMNCIE